MRRDTRKQPESKRSLTRNWPPPKARLEELVREAIVDAYRESEQRTGFLTMIEDSLALPFETEVLDMPVTVERIDLSDSDEIVAVCRRGSKLDGVLGTMDHAFRLRTIDSFLVFSSGL